MQFPMFWWVLHSSYTLSKTNIGRIDGNKISKSLYIYKKSNCIKSFKPGCIQIWSTINRNLEIFWDWRRRIVFCLIDALCWSEKTEEKFEIEQDRNQRVELISKLMKILSQNMNSKYPNKKLENGQAELFDPGGFGVELFRDLKNPE